MNRLAILHCPAQLLARRGLALKGLEGYWHVVDGYLVSPPLQCERQGQQGNR